MRAKEFGSWDSRDKSKGGFHSYGDGFNRELKGQPYQKYKEYAESDLDEYHKYPEIKDLAAEEKKNDDQSSKKDNKSRNSKVQNSTSKMVQNLVGRFVGITVGTVVLASTNPVLAERFPFVQQVTSMFNVEDNGGQNTPGGSGNTPGTNPGGENTPGGEEQTDPETVNLTANWQWSEDKTSATLELSDKDGNVIAVIPATVSEDKVEATCNEEGSATYSATADYEGETYSDEVQETLDPLGHYWDEATATVEDGKIVFVSRCVRCKEKIKGSFNIEEE